MHRLLSAVALQLRSVAAPACLAVFALAGCDRIGGTPRTPDAQVAARVNDADVTIHQVEYVLQRQARSGADAGEAAARRALDLLVEQEIAAQAARAQGLDREPGVIQALEAARREVLARAWQDRLAAGVVRPTSDEIDRWYADHPALFAQRRLYGLQEFLVDARGADVARVEQIAREAQGARALEEALTMARLRYHTRRFVQAAEDLPMPILEPMAKLEPGQSLVLPPQPVGVRIYTVLHAEPAPVDRRTATDPIDGFLLNDGKRKAVAEGMKPLREKARIEYRGSFASPASAPASAGG